MSYRLTKLIQSLSKEEVRNFKIYTSRFAHKGDEKKLITLFDAIRKYDKDEYDAKLINRLFPNQSKNSYYRLKNRLVKDIEESLAQLHQSKDEEFELHRLIQLSKIFAFKSDFEEAKKYLEKAEKLALEQENYGMLNIIYEKVLRLVHRLDFPTDTYMKKYVENAKRCDLNMQNHLFRADTLKKMRLSNFSGKESEIINVLDEHIAQLRSSNESLNSIKVRLQINAMMRSILLQKKDFGTLLNYCIGSYEEFKEEKVFDKSKHEEEIIMLVWIINAGTKTRKPDLVEYVEKLHQALLEYNKLFYDKYIWLYYQSKVITYTFSRQNKAAINLLEKVKEEKTVQDNTNNLLFTYINLSTLYYFEDNFSEAFSNLASVVVSPAFKGLSVEWKLRITLLEIMLRTDSGDADYALNRCKEVKRKYRKLLGDKAYERESQFVRLITQILRKPDILRVENFKTEAEDFISKSADFEPGSNELLNYALWLKSKIEKRPYYDLVPEIFVTN